ncbi:MAG: putative glycoside hydrolase [Peptococcaceae bacterium]|nr:putative glycoside hydrolase [Peptococcaceae bacterium]MDH7525728.1 putative glycoside hydrolase [Peptococcaceae bacterium]
MLKKYFFAGMVIVLLSVVTVAFYTFSAISPGGVQEARQNYAYQQTLRDSSRIIPLEEKVHYAKRFFAGDNRPISKEPVKVKGIYMSGSAVYSSTLFPYLIDLVDTTELNALVVDMKDDSGILAFDFDIPLAREIKARTHGTGQAFEEKMRVLYTKNIYPIARIVVFKDPVLAERKQELAIKRKDGGLWRDRKGLAWVDPHCETVWKYAVDVAKEAAKVGFREIQFDYVRFPTDGDVKNAVYPFAGGQKKEDVIQEFLRYARTELQPYNVFLAADVFGLTTLTLDDMGMGQKFEKVISQVDYICPMVYPSHYGPGNYGFNNPNGHPYEVVRQALFDGLKKINESGHTGVLLRPWLQDFDLGSPAYGREEVRAQIRAAYDSGLEEWMLWNAGNRYTKEALLE